MKISFKDEIKTENKVTAQEIIDILLNTKEIADIEEFLNPQLPIRLSLFEFNNAYKKKGQRVVALLKKIRKENQTVVVYSDYDADGITGAAILWETLHLLGFKTMPYVPHRKQEGYGFSIKGIDNVKKQFDPALIISVDHGITAKEKISYAKSIGIPIIITDHHVKPEKLPTDAVAIFHVPELSGSGVAYFFAKMIFDHLKDEHPKGIHSQLDTLKMNFQTDYVALAAIGTIADLVPLIGASRSIVKHGLEAFSRTKRVGLRAILEEADIKNKKITPYEIGFIIAPRINAVGRLEHAIDALRLLCTNDEHKARELAHKVGGKNRERQDLVTAAVNEAKAMVANSKLSNSKTKKLIILSSYTWHEGIIGLIASKIVEEYYRPTIVLTTSDTLQGFLKGSARSVPALHITDFLRSLKKHLIDVGGHKGAAGFTMKSEELSSFIKNAQKKARKLLSEQDLERTIEVDLKIPLSKITSALVHSLETLAPFGIGNPTPTFLSEVVPVQAGIFGKTNNHLRLLVQDKEKKAPPLELIGFSMAKIFQQLEKETKMDIVYTLDINRWNGNEKIRGIIRYLSR